MRRSGLILSRKFVIGILLWTTILATTEALRGSAVVLQAKTRAAEQKEQADEENNGPAAAAATATNVTKPQLTGIPQIDYVLDPNLPRELNGHNLTDYPFYNAVPEDIDFKCDGLHDGFYASVPHKCQVYHHCLYGTRFDFLCANYTAFDQKTFICHFVSEVDCDNSPKYFKRNEALYKEATTTTTSTTTTTTATTPLTTTAAAQPAQSNGGTRHNGPRRRRPYRRRRPMYEYYYDDEEYADPEYYDDEVSSLNHRRTPYRKHNKDIYQSENRDTEGDYDTQHSSDQVKPVATIRPSTSGSSLSGSAASVYERPRIPPKIRRPVPKSERDKYDYIPKQSSSTAAPTTTTTTTTTTTEKPQTASGNGKGGKQPQSDDEYYEDDEEYEYEEPKPASKSKPHLDYDFPTGFEDTRRHVNRYRSRMPPARKRAEVYDDYDTKERPSRINRRKEYTRYDGDRPRNSRPTHRMKTSRHEEEPAHHKYPAAKKRPAAEPEHRAGSGRRAQESKRPPIEDDYYYDDEEPEEAPPKRARRPQKMHEKSKSTAKQTQQPKERYQDEERSQPDPPANVKYVKDLVPTPRNGKANSHENEVPKVSPSYNEISTTESVSSPSKFTPNHVNQKYPTKTVKIVTNSLKDEPDDAADTYPRSHPETRMSSAQTKPVSETLPSAAPAPAKFTNVVSLKTLSPQTVHRPESYSEVVRKEKRPFEYDDGTITATTMGSRYINKTIIPVRHFVVSSVPRKPSHFLASLSTPVINAYRDDSSAQHYRPEEKPQQKQLPQQSSGPTSKVPGHHTDFYKPATSPQNITHFAPMSFRTFAIPVSNDQPKPNVRPVKEDHLAPETLNAINNGNFYHTGFSSEPKSFANVANEASKSTSPSQQNYRQDHRLFNTNGDRFYTTNSISFPPHPPTNYDITAPGPSAPGEEPTAPEKKYSETPSYTANADYDVTYNDALQPSTLHPVRRYPSTSFYAIQHQQQPLQQQQQQQQQQNNQQQQQRSVVPSRLPTDYAFNEGAYNSLSRSQSRFTK